MRANSTTNLFLGRAIEAADAEEIMGAVPVAITGRLPHTALHEAIVTHPN